MSAKQSNLSDSHYGYDFVVATTQQSINATLKTYLYYTNFPKVRMYWNQDAEGRPVPVSYEELMKQTNNTDPLSLSAWKNGEPKSQSIQNVENSNFYFCFEASIGIPANVTPNQIPDIVTLQPGSQAVSFRLMTANFKIVVCNFGRHGLTSIDIITQPNDKVWAFKSLVLLRNVLNNNNLPASVQKAIDNLGRGAFSVQQLMFDLDNAALESSPAIEGLDAGTPAYTALSQVFMGAYFEQMKKAGEPVLNYTLQKNDDKNIPPASLTLTSMGFGITPYGGATVANEVNAINPLNTFNYLCAINGNKLPPIVPFAWNWVEQDEASLYHGVVSIKRANIVNRLNDVFSSKLNEICSKPKVRCWLSGFADSEINYQLGFERDYSSQKYSPTSDPKDSEGFTPVLKFHYSQQGYDQAGLNGALGNLKCIYTVDSIISLKDNQIKLDTTSNVYVDLAILGGHSTGNIAKYRSVEKYTLSENSVGQLTSDSPVPTITDLSEGFDESTWAKIMTFGEIKDVLNSEKDYTKNILSSFMNEYSSDIVNIINAPQSFVFPAGETFAFKNVFFSDNLDLVSHITYVSPVKK